MASSSTNQREHLHVSDKALNSTSGSNGRAAPLNNPDASTCDKWWLPERPLIPKERQCACTANSYSDWETCSAPPQPPAGVRVRHDVCTKSDRSKWYKTQTTSAGPFLPAATINGRHYADGQWSASMACNNLRMQSFDSHVDFSEPFILKCREPSSTKYKEFSIVFDCIDRAQKRGSTMSAETTQDGKMSASLSPSQASPRASPAPSPPAPAPYPHLPSLSPSRAEITPPTRSPGKAPAGGQGGGPPSESQGGASPRSGPSKSPESSGRSPGRSPARGRSPGGRSPGGRSSTGGRSPTGGGSPGRSSGRSPGKSSARGRSPGRSPGKSPARGRSPGGRSPGSEDKPSGNEPGKSSGRKPPSKSQSSGGSHPSPDDSDTPAKSDDTRNGSCESGCRKYMPESPITSFIESLNIARTRKAQAYTRCFVTENIDMALARKDCVAFGADSVPVASQAYPCSQNSNKVKLRCQGLDSPIGNWSACHESSCKINSSDCKEIRQDCQKLGLDFPSSSQLFFDCKNVDRVNTFSGQCTQPLK